MTTIKSIEEKATRYDEAIKIAKEYFNSPRTCFDIEQLCNIFPELAESEDEKIKKEIITYIKWCEDGGYCAKEEMIRWITFLEKQGEQNPAWSEKDELHIKELESLVKRVWAIAEHKNDKETIHKMSNLSFFLKTLKPQPKQEWSEDDERYLNNTISYLKDATEFKETAKLCIDWLKSLSPQNTWKPSDEQMEAFDDFIYAKYPNIEKYGAAVKSLYQDLKKLRED